MEVPEENSKPDTKDRIKIYLHTLAGNKKCEINRIVKAIRMVGSYSPNERQNNG